MNRKFAAFFFATALPLALIACGGDTAEAPAEQPPVVEAPAVAQATTAPVVEPTATPTQPPIPTPTTEIPKAAPTAEPVAETWEADTEAISAERVEFTATTGLDRLDAFRMSFSTDFDGTQAGRPSQGTLSGVFEATKKPQATHWQINMDGSAFQQLAMLGGGVELYDLGDTIYIQNPGDGSWIGMPAMLVDTMLPQEMYNPEDSIELPKTALRHPGEETVNGMATQKYTFGIDDLAGDTSNLDSVDGTIWVAIDGDYVVKYESVVSGQFQNLEAGGIQLPDNGTISMTYDLSDVNADFEISAPAGAQTIPLTDLLFN
jgi:hypothetical protein